MLLFGSVSFCLFCLKSFIPIWKLNGVVILPNIVLPKLPG